MSEQELLRIDKLIKAAGLIKVWDGVNWVDLRDEMARVIASYLKLKHDFEETAQFVRELSEEHEELKRLLFADE